MKAYLGYRMFKASLGNLDLVSKSNVKDWVWRGGSVTKAHIAALAGELHSYPSSKAPNTVF